MTSSTTSSETIDLTGFLLAHAGLRQELGLLAGVAAESLDATRTRLAEEQIDLVVRFLHHHHTIEDDLMWPLLRERVPSCAADLDLLEAEHELIDPLIEAVADVSRPLLERAPRLQELHELLNAHLDREERTAVPLLRAHLTTGVWEEVERQARDGLPRRDVPLVFCWVLGAAEAEDRARALAGLPAPVRALLRVFWAPAYARRVRRLYGPSAASAAV